MPKSKKTQRAEKPEAATPDAFDRLVDARKGKAGQVGKPPTAAIEDEDGEDMSEDSIAKMVGRAEERKEEEKARVEATVDSQDWNMMDPVIPEELKGRVWIAVYKCPDGHKTKATNRQATTGVMCWRHRDAGKQVKAVIMPQFLARPNNEDPDAEKRRKARKGAE